MSALNRGKKGRSVSGKSDKMSVKSTDTSKKGEKEPTEMANLRDLIDRDAEKGFEFNVADNPLPLNFEDPQVYEEMLKAHEAEAEEIGKLKEELHRR